MISVPSLTISELEAEGKAKLQTGPFGTQLKASEYVAAGIPVINVRNIGFGDIRHDKLEYLNEVKAEKLHQHYLRKGDIVFGRKGAVERHVLINEDADGWIQGSDCLRARISSENVCNRYLSYYLKTQAHQDWMQALCSFGATMSSLNQDIVRRIRFPAPLIEVQKKIAAILSAYDDLIENNKRRIALLEQMAEEIYREWFVRRRFPGHENTRFEKGVPQGWLQQKIASFAKCKYGFTESAVQDKTLPKFLRVKDINKASYISWVDVPNCPIQDTEFQKYKLERNDLLIARMADPGKVGIVEQDITAVFASYLIKIEYDLKTITPYYLFFTLRMEAYTKYFSSANSGATRGSINGKLIGNTQVIIPSKHIMDRFEDIVRPIRSQIGCLNRSSEKLTESRNKLLARLISGKLSVEDLDIQFPPSMQEDVEIPEQERACG